MKFKSQLTSEDYVFLNKLLSRKTVIESSCYWISMLICSIYFLPHTAALPVSLLLVFLLVVSTSSYFIFVPNKAEEIYSKSERLQRLEDYEINNVGIIMSYGDEKNIYKWDEVINWSKKKSFFLLPLVSGHFIIIPYRTFSDKSQLSEIEPLFRQYSTVVDNKSAFLKSFFSSLFTGILIGIMLASVASYFN